jgi:hypothetical protein
VSSQISRAPLSGEADEIRCSFCGRARRDVGGIVCGETPAIAICDQCVALAAEILAEQGAAPPEGE